MITKIRNNMNLISIYFVTLSFYLDRQSGVVLRYNKGWTSETASHSQLLFCAKLSTDSSTGLAMLSRYARVNPAKANIRNLWTHRTASRPELAQAVADSVADLPKKPIDICVALISQSFPANDLLKLNTEFLKHINPKIFIGAVVDRVPSPQSGGHGVSVLIGQEEDATAFVLEDSADRKKFKSVSVGRWGKVQDFNRFKYEENDIEKFGWDAFKSVSTNVHGHDLLPQLQNL
jgi:hypothetical protein